jgi:superfamily II DNA or RNA helicase
MKISKKGECIRTVANYSKQKATDKIDKANFNLTEFKKNIDITSPKLGELIKTINALDEADMKNHKKVFKHIIYTDVKKSSAGSKMIAAGLMANGFTNIYDKRLKLDEGVIKNNPYKNFALLCSVAIYDKPFPIKLKKSILSTFNQRPENIYGEQIRFLILDQGFKEGIDVFDVKYVHLFEPLITEGDEKQAIGRGTRYCGQKGLEFDATTGWPLHVFRYNLYFDDEGEKKYNASEIHKLFIDNSGLNLSKLIFAGELEKISRYGAVDYELTQNIHGFGDGSAVYVPDSKTLSSIIGPSYDILSSVVAASKDEYMQYRTVGMKLSSADMGKKVKNPLSLQSSPPLSKSKESGGGIKGKKKKGINKFLHKAPQKLKKFSEMRKYIRERFMQLKWEDIKFENKCKDVVINDDEKPDRIIKYTPTQEFVSKYFDKSSANKGLLLWHSVGTGKTCSAIAVASHGFEPHGYTVLWVTRHTLKTDIWKNMFGSVCSATLRRRIIKGEDIPENIQKNPLKYLSESWVMPISYKQFTNMLAEKNDIFRLMKKRNGAIDPLRKTLVIIDEVHKLYSTDLPAAERPNLKLLKDKIKNSYKISGKDSVRLLLMSATPYTSDPMDLIKILNLMKEDDMPESFEDFAQEYLDNNYVFTDNGARKYLDNISGMISYLNREKDIRQFAYPVFYKVKAFMSKKPNVNDTDIQAELTEVKNVIEQKKAVKAKTKEEKQQLKDEKIVLKEKEKELKKLLKTATKSITDDISQETAIDQCLKK